MSEGRMCNSAGVVLCQVIWLMTHVGLIILTAFIAKTRERPWVFMSILW